MNMAMRQLATTPILFTCLTVFCLLPTALLAQDLPKDSLVDYKLKGPVKQILHKKFEAQIVKDTFHIQRELNPTDWPSKLIFNKGGRRILRSTCNMYGSECVHRIVSYDESGFVKREKVIEEDGQVWHQEDYTKGSGGKVEKTKQYVREPDGLTLQYTYEHSYDNLGREILRKSYDENDTYKRQWIYKYLGDSEKLVTMDEINDDNETEKAERLYYDTNGVLTEEHHIGMGITMKKIIYQPVNDSITQEITYAQDDDGLTLRSKNLTQITDGSTSNYEIEVKDGHVDTVRYEFTLYNETGQKTKRQRCKYEELAYEEELFYDSLGRVKQIARFDYENNYQRIKSFEYDSLNHPVKEIVEFEDGERKEIRRYYDVYSNWTHWLERHTSPQIQYTHLHTRKFEYYDE